MKWSTSGIPSGKRKQKENMLAKELNRLFERLIASESSYKVFNDILDYLLFSMCIGHHPDYELKNPFAESKAEKLQSAMEFYKAMGEAAVYNKDKPVQVKDFDPGTS